MLTRRQMLKHTALLASLAQLPRQQLFAYEAKKILHRWLRLVNWKRQ